MDLNLINKNVFVTGSTKGIGFAIAKAFMDQGCNVGINGRDKKHLDKAVTELNNPRVLGFPGDVTNLEEAKGIYNSFIKSFNNIDILICNVGSGSSSEPGKEDSTDWNKMLSINLFSATNIIEVFRNNLINSKGVITCISSICGIEVIPGAPVAYSASKSALNSYIKCSARPFGKSGVRINGVAPGNILFKGSVWEKKIQEDPDGVKSMVDKEVPLGRLGSTEDISNLVLLLSSPVSKNITGEILVSDGGQVRS